MGHCSKRIFPFLPWQVSLSNLPGNLDVRSLAVWSLLQWSSPWSWRWSWTSWCLQHPPSHQAKGSRYCGLRECALCIRYWKRQLRFQLLLRLNCCSLRRLFPFCLVWVRKRDFWWAHHSLWKWLRVAGYRARVKSIGFWYHPKLRPNSWMISAFWLMASYLVLRKWLVKSEWIRT